MNHVHRVNVYNFVSRQPRVMITRKLARPSAAGSQRSRSYMLTARTLARLMRVLELSSVKASFVH